MENILNQIHGQFIKLPDAEVRKNKEILQSIVAIFVDKLKSKDPLFNKLFRRVFYGGSFYDGLRVGKPAEFDLDFLLDMRQYGESVLTESEMDGFVHLQVVPFMEKGRVAPNPPYQVFQKTLLNSTNFLSTTKVLKWMESLFQRCMNDFPHQGGGFYFMQTLAGQFQIKFHKGPPALTLQVVGEGVNFKIDLVACFVFAQDKWPCTSYRMNPFPSNLTEFFIVPKPPKNPSTFQVETYWRLSFQEQERQLLANKGRLKTAARLLKKMRDTQGHHCIASYYIKTVFLHFLDRQSSAFWNNSLSHVFMTTLIEYSQFLTHQNVPYYWDPEHNLLDHVKGDTLQNYARRLENIITDITKNPENVAKYLLSQEESKTFFNLGSSDLLPDPFASPVQNNEMLQNSDQSQSQCAIL